MWKLFKKKRDLYDYLSDEDKEMYDKINSGMAAGNLIETIAFLARIDAIKAKYNIK